MSKYKVGSYIRLSRDENYSNSDSIDNQIKLTDILNVFFFLKGEKYINS